MKNIKNITGIDKTCYILDDYSLQETVPYEPAEYWYLRLYTITLDDIDGAFSSSKQKYMVLEYPSYTEVNSSNKINDCIWSVPYMAYVFRKPGIKRFTTVNAIKKFYSDQIETHNSLLEELENYRFYHMGISDYDKIEGSHYIEYKVSSRQPDKWKCYYVQEYYITGIDSLGLLNLADPEGLHCYRYFPLIPKPTIESDPFYFAGKHFSSNITHLIQNSYNKILQYSNSIPGEILRYQLHGIVFKLDVVGFTKIYNKIVAEMKSLDENGREIAVHFITGLSSIFESRMQEFGISQYVIEGDGLTATMPINENIQDGIALIIDCVNRIKNDINSLVSKLEDYVSLRCSIIVGNYFYGKLAGLSSSKQASGEIMISLSRMDQYLQDCIKNNATLLGKHLILCVDNQICTICNEFLQHSGFAELISRANFRETRIDSTVFYKEE